MRAATRPAALVSFAALALVSGCSGDSGAGAADGPVVPVVDAGTVDGPAVDGPAVDVALEVGGEFLALAPCPTPASYVVGATSIAAHTHSYHPPCLQVAVGATVTFEASSEHPLEPRPQGTPGNPIPQRYAPATVAFPAAGLFPYQCPEHVDAGMIGVVWVR